MSARAPAGGGARGLWRTGRVVVSMGAGGVGKTTVSAALALAAAQEGKRTLVMTVDPARRLAQALGVADPGADRLRLDPAPLAALGVTLRAPVDVLMPDIAATFDKMINAYAASPEARDAILANKIYRHLCQTMSGAYEYAAVEALHAVVEEGAWDVIVLDTPPAQNAIDFLEAPEKVASFFDGAQIPWLMGPARLAGRVSRRLWDVGMPWIYAGLAKVAGGDTLRDIGDFLFSLDGMYPGLSARARAVHALLTSPEVAYLVVAAPGPGPQAAARQLADELTRSAVPPRALVINRLHQRVWPAGQAQAGEAACRRHLGGLEAAQQEVVLGALRQMQAQAEGEARAVAALADEMPGVPVTYLEELPPGLTGAAAVAALVPHLAPP